MRKILPFLLFTSCTLLASSLHAQTYPVQGNAFLIPPYSLRLSDYATSTSERLAMNVLLTDVTRAELRVRFRLHMEGPTISIDSKAEYVGNPVVLQGGVSLRLTNLDLAEYFHLQNINFTGITEREFLQKGTLPEGLYKICFDVLEYNRGVKISQSICAQAFFVLNAPPIINLPRQGETLRAQMPQNVIMQWTPRHTGSPNSAFNTQYEIKVVEVWPSDRNPNDAILTQPAIYETTTANTSLIYGPDATQLEPGRTYAFRVRAVPMGEAGQLDLFINNGYSETVSFVYGQTCKPPAAVTGKVTGPHTSTLDWLQEPNHTAYKIHFRKQGRHEWLLYRASLTTIDLKDLEANTGYEYEVSAVCGDFESPYSPAGELKTMEAQTPLYVCGAKPKGTLNTNQEPLPTLKAGDIVHTLTVEVTITKVSGGSGTFSGEAEARLKIFNNAILSLVFKDIRVNKDYWLIGGYFEAVSGGVESPKGTQEAVDVLGDVLSESQGGGTSNDYSKPPPDPTTFVAQETITIPAGIQTITKNETTGIVTVTDTKGVKHDLPQGKDIAVVDEKGRGALVDKQGQITNTTAEQAKAAAKREYGFSIVFEKATESKAGFDAFDKKTTALKNTYETIDQYHVPWKAISTGADVVKGSLNFGTAKDLVFEQEGAKLTYNEFTNILTINSVPAGSIAHVIVKEKSGDKEKIRGKLNVAGYAPMSKTVHIVPVNNATATLTAAEIQTYLNDVYGQALVSWQVDIKNKIEVSFTGDFDDGGSGLLSTYTGDMRKVIKAYGSLEQDHYYIFLLERGKNKTGYMPRGKRAGFVFLNNQNSEELKHTIAHELGHGAFTLRHPFAEYPSVTEKSTDNLMDYAGGTHLYKWQWDQIHNPVLVIGLFEGDEEGEFVLVDNLVGALVGGLVDISMQIAVNAYEKYYEKKEVSLWKITWWPDVAISAGAGFISSGASSIVKFATFAKSPVGRKALKIAIEYSTDFLINSACDIAKKYIDGEEQNYTQTLLFNFVGSGTFATLNNTGLFNKFKDKILGGAKKLPIKTLLPAPVKAKADVLKEKIYEKAKQSILAVQKKVVSKKQVSNRVLTENKIIPEPGVKSSEFLEKTTTINKELREAVEQETNAIEKEAKETIEEATPKEVDEAIAKEVESVRDVDNLFPGIVNQTDFQGFRNLCKNNSKVSVSLVDDKWEAFVANTKSQYGIGNKRNLAKMEFNGQEKLIASGEGVNRQMISSGKFIPNEFVVELKSGKRVFDPSISTRSLDTESIGLEYFAKQKGAVKGEKYPEVIGELKITSDLCPCTSCSTIFQQFSEMFPNVNIKIVTSPKIHY